VNYFVYFTISRHQFRILSFFILPFCIPDFPTRKRWNPFLKLMLNAKAFWKMKFDFLRQPNLHSSYSFIIRSPQNYSFFKIIFFMTLPCIIHHIHSLSYLLHTHRISIVFIGSSILRWCLKKARCKSFFFALRLAALVVLLTHSLHFKCHLMRKA
jgi:hypothetical protein